MTVQDMDKFTLLRWVALLDGVNLIYNKGLECGLTDDQISLKQTHLTKYIDESTERVRIT